MFGAFDANGNDYLSLAEVDKAVRAELGCGDLFGGAAPVRCAPSPPPRARPGRSPLSADYVERSEFKLLLAYLSRYLELHVAYRRLDASDDKQLSLPEFRKGVGLLAQWGIDIDDDRIDAEFASIDANGGGIVLFDELRLGDQETLALEGGADDDEHHHTDKAAAASKGAAAGAAASVEVGDPNRRGAPPPTKRRAPRRAAAAAAAAATTTSADVLEMSVGSGTVTFSDGRACRRARAAVGPRRVPLHDRRPPDLRRRARGQVGPWRGSAPRGGKAPTRAST